MTWHWYVARENEIFVDHDNDRAVSYAMHKLQINCPAKLPVKAAYHYASGTPGHYHMVVALTRPMPVLERASWAMHLRSDIRRTQIILMRLSRQLPGPDFLITPEPYSFRQPDHVCRCEGKHKEPEITQHCPVLRVLLGNERSAEYFALEPNARTFRLAPGRIQLEGFKVKPNEVEQWKRCGAVHPKYGQCNRPKEHTGQHFGYPCGLWPKRKGAK